MGKGMDDEFIVSEADAEIIATLFRQGVSDYPSIIKAVKWNKAKQNQFYDFMMFMGYVDFEDPLLDEVFTPSSSCFRVLRVPKDKYEEFFHNLPIEFGEDFWDEEWYRGAYDALRQFLIQLDKKNPSFKKENSYSLDNMKMLVGMAFCPLIPKPKNLCVEIQNLMRIRLKRINKDRFSFNEILLAFDKAFANYFG